LDYINGVDTAQRLTKANAEALADCGMKFVGRYLVPKEYDKSLTESEADIIRSAGLGILLIYEIEASRARRGEKTGHYDGLQAKYLAERMQIPTDAAIYFCVDYDAPKTDYALIEQYLYAAKASVAPYRCGVYGKADLINSVKADVYWQCVAWSYGLVSDKANVYQYEWQGGDEAQYIAKKTGVGVDMNRCGDMAAAGIWMPPKPKHWYDDAMEWAEKNGLMKDGRPEDAMTRAEVATVLYRFNDYLRKAVN
jgi:hypothetical protein